MTYEYITAIQNVYLSGAPQKAAVYQNKLKNLDPENKNPLIRGDKKLQLKRFLALHLPSVLSSNTKRRNKKLEKGLERFT
jgi:hypothetical protein